MSSNTENKDGSPAKQEVLTPKKNISEGKDTPKRSEKSSQDSEIKLDSDDNLIKSSAEGSSSKSGKLNNSKRPNKDKTMDTLSDNTTNIAPNDSSYKDEKSSTFYSRVLAIGSETAFNIARSVLFMLAGNVVFYFIQIVFRPLFVTQSNAEGPSDPAPEQESQSQALEELLKKMAASIKSAQADEEVSKDIRHKESSKKNLEQLQGAQSQIKSKSAAQSLVKDKTIENATMTKQNKRSLNSDTKSAVNSHDHKKITDTTKSALQNNIIEPATKQNLSDGKFNISALKSVNSLEETSSLSSKSKPALKNIKTEKLPESSLSSELNNSKDVTDKRFKDTPLKTSIESADNHKINTKEGTALQSNSNLEEKKSDDGKYDKVLKDDNEILEIPPTTSNIVNDLTKSQGHTENENKDIKKRSTSVPVNDKLDTNFTQKNLLKSQESNFVECTTSKKCDNQNKTKGDDQTLNDGTPDQSKILGLKKQEPQLKTDHISINQNQTEEEDPSQKSALKSLVSKFQRIPDEINPLLKTDYTGKVAVQPTNRINPNDIMNESLESEFVKDNSTKEEEAETNNIETSMEHTNYTKPTTTKIESSNLFQNPNADGLSRNDENNDLETGSTSTELAKNIETSNVSQESGADSLSIKDKNNALKTGSTSTELATNIGASNVPQVSSGDSLSRKDKNDALETGSTSTELAQNIGASNVSQDSGAESLNNALETGSTPSESTTNIGTNNVSQQASDESLRHNVENNALKTKVTLPKLSINKIKTELGLELDKPNNALETNLNTIKSTKKKSKTSNATQNHTSYSLELDETNNALETNLNSTKLSEDKSKASNISQKLTDVGLELDETNNALETDLKSTKSSEYKSKTSNLSQKLTDVGLELDETNNALETDLNSTKSSEDKSKTSNMSQKLTDVGLELDETNNALETDKTTSNAMSKNSKRKRRKNLKN